MKRTISILTLLLAAFSAQAQVKVQNIEDAVIQVNYNFRWVSNTTARAEKFREEISVPEWQLRDSTETILGFPCQMAEAQFKGRHWTAFFAHDLPFSEGPWKLSGLPGLILKAFCDNGDYSYDAVFVTTENLPKVGFYDFKKGGRTKMTRDRYFLEWYRAINDDLSFKIRQAYVSSGVKPGERKKKVQANRDFEETDYQHE